MVGDAFHRTVGELDRRVGAVGQAQRMQCVLEAHQAHADRAVAHIGVARLFDRVEVQVDHVVQHAHGGAHGAGELGVVELAIADMVGQVDRAEVAHGDFAVAGVQRDLGAQVRAVDHAHVLLRAAQVARVLERQPRVAGLEQHGQHLAPQVQRAQALVDAQLAALAHGFVLGVAAGKGLAGQIVQVRGFARAEQRPRAVFHHPLHEQVRHPVGGVHVMGAATVVTGVLAQFEEFLDVGVPGFQVGAHRALALAALVDRDGSVVGHLQERDHALALAVGALDMAAERAHRGPVVAEAAGVLGQQRVFLDAVENLGQIIAQRGQVAAGQLAVQGAGVEQCRRRAHEVEAGQHAVELDRAVVAFGFVQRQAHRHAHEEGLRQFDAAAFDMQEVAVVQGLQAEIAELQVGVGVQRLAQAGKVEFAQTRVEQLGLDAALDGAGEGVGVQRGHVGLRHMAAEHFATDRIQQQTGGDLVVGRIALDHLPGAHDHGAADFGFADAVVQVLQRIAEDGGRIGIGFQTDAGGMHQRGHSVQVQRRAAAVGTGDVQGRGGGQAQCFAGGAALGGAAFAVQHVGAGHFLFTCAHQGQFDLVLDVFDMDRAAFRAAADQGRHHGGGQLFHFIAQAAGAAGFAAEYGQECLAQGDGNLVRGKRHHVAVATDALV